MAARDVLHRLLLPPLCMAPFGDPSDWFNEGRTSTKERFPLRADEVAPLLSWIEMMTTDDDQ